MGIGAFGRAMIPLGSAAGTAFNTYNTYQNQKFNQDMQMKQYQLEQQKNQIAQMEESRAHDTMQYNALKELANQRQQVEGQKASAAFLSQWGATQTDPGKRNIIDKAAGMAAAGMPTDGIIKMLTASGITLDQETKAWLAQYKALRDASGAGLDTAVTGAITDGGSTTLPTPPAGPGSPGGPSPSTAGGPTAMSPASALSGRFDPSRLPSRVDFSTNPTIKGPGRYQLKDGTMMVVDALGNAKYYPPGTGGAAAGSAGAGVVPGPAMGPPPAFGR